MNKINFKEYSKNLIFAGGCALNSSANRLITNQKNLFEKIFITYAPGDNGGALGAAFKVCADYKEKIINSENPYLGKDFLSEEIEKILNSKFYNGKISYYRIEDKIKLYREAANLINEGKIVGWFQGRMEFGPRALGNRSILADPRNPNMKEIINKKIKRRESFRPFAPSVLKEFQNEWFNSDFENPYMSSLANVKDEKKKLIPAVTHIDGTARFQTVDKEKNLHFFNLINEFYKITKVPVLLNTSFNENEPIVMKPEESLDCLIRTNLDVVFINNFVVRKLL